MRMKMTGGRVACLPWECWPAGCDSARRHYAGPPFKGNDTGGIISYAMAAQTECKAAGGRPLRPVRQGGEIPRRCRTYEGGYISFACCWVPYGSARTAAPHALLRRLLGALDTSQPGVSRMMRQLAVLGSAVCSRASAGVAQRGGPAGAQGRPVEDQDGRAPDRRFRK